MEAITTSVERLNDLDRKAIVNGLTRPGSEFQSELGSRSKTPVAIVRLGTWRIASWAATHNWRGMQTLEGFTVEPERRKGLARVAAAMLVASGLIDPKRPVAVFSPNCVGIARSVGCRDVRLFERNGEDWIENSQPSEVTE